MSDQSEKCSGGSVCPKLMFGLAACACICAIIAAASCFCGSRNAGATRRLWVPMVVETNGSQVALGETRQLEFWTPSARTKDYLQKADGKVAAKEKWQSIETDDVVMQFGSVLHSNRNVFGYRRMEVWGQGRTTFKPGWWWTMNVTTNYSVGDLAQAYRDFWKTPQAVLIEVIDNRGIDDK